MNYYYDSVRTGKNSRFKIFKGAIRIFVTPKNEGIDIILPDMSKEIKVGFFLNLLSHPVCRQAGYIRLILRLCLREVSAKQGAPFIFLFFVHLYLNHNTRRAQSSLRISLAQKTYRC